MHRTKTIEAFVCATIVGVTACTTSSGATASGARSSFPTPPAAAATYTPPANAPTYTPQASTASFSLLPWAGNPGGPYPIKDCSDAGGIIGASDPVALVQPHGLEVALRDYADPAHPRTVCRFSNNQIVQLIDSRHIVVVGVTATNLFAVVDLPELRHHWFQLPVAPKDWAVLLGVSPGLDAVAWLSLDQNRQVNIHITTSQGDQVTPAAPSPSTGGGRLAMYERAAFSPSGKYLFLLDRRLGGNNNLEDPSLRTLLILQGSRVLLRLEPPAGGWAVDGEPAMPLWSPISDTLFYRQNGDVWAWSPETGAAILLPKTAWCFPTISADGRYLAYGAPHSPDGTYNVYLADLRGSLAPQAIGKGPRNAPGFLNANLLWYRAWTQQTCTTDGSQSLLYDTTDGSESASSLDQVYNTWPATSSDYNGVDAFLAINGYSNN